MAGKLVDLVDLVGTHPIPPKKHQNYVVPDRYRFI